VNVFPRFKERDPYRVLGVDREARRCARRHRLLRCRIARRAAPRRVRPPPRLALQATYEEIQEARNYLVTEHKACPSGPPRRTRVAGALAALPARRARH
jgi:hypothetical protein